MTNHISNETWRELVADAERKGAQPFQGTSDHAEPYMDGTSVSDSLGWIMVVLGLIAIGFVLIVVFAPIVRAWLGTGG